MRMERAVLSITYFLLLTLFIRAQIWCPPGAEWTYTFTNGWTVDGFARFTYAGDTTIGSIPSQVLSMHAEGDLFGSPFSEDYGPYYTALDGDLVSIWTTTGFDTLYYFGALPGDHWQLTSEDGTPSMIPVTVSDTGTMVIDGLPLRYLTTASDTIVERLGSLHGFMLPWVSFTLDAPGGPLRCYEDIGMAYNAFWWNYGCGSLTGLHGSESGTVSVIFPNPGTDHLMLSLPPGRNDILLSDAMGRIVLRSSLSDQQVRVDTSDLGRGVYTYRLMDQSGHILAQGHWQRM